MYPGCGHAICSSIAPAVLSRARRAGRRDLDRQRPRFCGKLDSHPFELLLALEEIGHRTTNIRSPRTNGFVERMNRTLLDECFRVEGRKTWYIEPAETQRDLDRFLSYYNLERTHQGYGLRGRTPAQAVREALGITDLPPFVRKQRE